MQQQHFFPTLRGLSESRRLVVTADPTWPTVPDDMLLGRVEHAVWQELQREQWLARGALPTISWFEIKSWRNAASEYTLTGLRPVARGAWGRNYHTLRTAQRVEVQVVIHYSVPQYAYMKL